MASLHQEQKLLEPFSELIEGCIKGDRQSQTQLYNALAQQMFVVCLRYCSTREEAEEVLQEGFMKVFQYVHQYKSEGPFAGWVRKIMVNCALQKYRGRTHLRAVFDVENTELEDTSHEEILSRIGTKELLNMVQQLPPAYRMVFNLFVFEGMKHREIAELLNISEGTSKSNLWDARYLLQKAVASSLQTSKEKIN